MRTIALLAALAGCQSATPTPAEPAPTPPPTHAPAEPEEPTEPIAKAFDGPVKVTFVDVGRGDAILIQAGDADALIDTGANGHWDGELKVALEGVTGALELLVVTHAHEDHVAQADEVMQLLEVRRVITNGPPPPSERPKSWDDYTAALSAEGLEPEPALANGSMELVPGVALDVLSAGGEGSNMNDNSLVLVLTYAGREVLLAADLTEGGQKLLIEELCTATDCPALQADALKVPHHGAADFAQEFFERVQPSYAVITAGFHSEEYCHPRNETYQALALLGAKIFSTSAEGTGDVSVTIWSDGNMQWDYPDEPVFVWQGMRGAKCVGPLVYEQGTPRPYLAE